MHILKATLKTVNRVKEKVILAIEFNIFHKIDIRYSQKS